MYKNEATRVSLIRILSATLPAIIRRHVPIHPFEFNAILQISVVLRTLTSLYGRPLNLLFRKVSGSR